MSGRENFIECNWTHIVHDNWVGILNNSLPKLMGNEQAQSSLSPRMLTLLALLLSFGTKLFVVHLIGHYNTKRRYFEPQASEVRAYSAQIGSDTSSKSNLKDAVLTDQVPDYIASVALALLDPLSLSYSSDLALHDYGRPLFSSFVTVLLSRGLFYTMAYNVFMYFCSENFATPIDFLERRFNSTIFSNACSLLLFLSEMLYVLLQVNSLTRSLTSLGESYHFWLLIVCTITLVFTQFGSANLLRMGLLLYVSSLFVFFWISMELRARFNSKLVAVHSINQTNDPYDGAEVTTDEVRAEHGGNVIQILLYESSIGCIILAAPFLHCSFRFSQVNYMIVQVVQPKQRRKRLFMRAFLLNVTLQMCHVFMLRAVLTLRRQGGCDPILTGKVCHFSVIDSSFYSSVTLHVIYLVNNLHLLCWTGAIRKIAVAYGATASWMRNFLKLCLVGQRWAMMDRWRRQNGRIMFRNCDVINLDRLLFTTLLVVLIIAIYFCCVDFAVWDPSLRWLQVLHYFLLDLRFILFTIPCLLGLCFCKFTLNHLYGVSCVLIAIYGYIVLWSDRIDHSTLQYKVMVPMFLQHTAIMRRHCQIAEKLKPIINVGKRITDHEIVHLIDLDAFYPAAVIAASIMAAALSSVSGKPCVLRSPFFSIVSSTSGNIGNSLKSEFHNRLRSLSKTLSMLAGDRSSVLKSLLMGIKNEIEASAIKAEQEADLERRFSKSPDMMRQQRVEWIRNERQSIDRTDAVIAGLNEAVKQHQELRRRWSEKQKQQQQE